MKNCAGFSLVEIIIAMLILTGVGAMTMSAFVSSAKTTQPGANIGYNFGRGIFEKMYEFVRQDQWAAASLPLSLATPGTGGPFTPQGSTTTLNGKTYTAAYTVNGNSGTAIDSNSDGKEDFRRVRMTVTW